MAKDKVIVPRKDNLMLMEKGIEALSDAVDKKRERSQQEDKVRNLKNYKDLNRKLCFRKYFC